MLVHYRESPCAGGGRGCCAFEWVSWVGGVPLLPRRVLESERMEIGQEGRVKLKGLFEDDYVQAAVTEGILNDPWDVGDALFLPIV